VEGKSRIVFDSTKIRAAMVERGLSSAALAKLAGVQPNTITRATSQRPVTRESARRIGQALADTPVVMGLEALLAS